MGSIQWIDIIVIIVAHFFWPLVILGVILYLALT